ncbi:MAG TPA: S8 family serine peptidase [Solirubrobacteraceae bacterium]|jgi:subtilase family serine protease
MKRWSTRRRMFFVGAPALAASVALAGAAAGAPAALAAPSQSTAATAQSNGGAPVPAGTLRAPVTGAPILGTAGAAHISAAAAAPSAVPASKSGQIAKLKAALASMTANYPQLANFTPGPQDIFDYDVGSLWKQGIDGSGETIALLEGWDNKNIDKIVASFDKELDLPNPQISTIYPAGPLPSTCPKRMKVLGSYGSCSAWANGELPLDVITAHMIAPYAKIVLAVTPADTVVPSDPAENVAPPEMMESVEDIAANHLADVISVSDGTGETTYPSSEELLAQNPGELAAASAGIPLLGATGDCGVVQNLAQANAQCEDAGDSPSTASWDDSPWVTAVGGSVPNVSSQNGQKLGPDPLWHDPAPVAQFAEGAGFSSVFARPSYQDGVASITGSAMRAVPDLTMDAQDGTSEATPMLAGVLALATQANGGDLGPINPALYGTLGPAGAGDGIADVVSGNNSADNPDGTVRVPGFVAGTGYDVASGWGTIDAPSFVSSLVAATQASGEESAARQQAQQQLSSLQTGAISLSPQTVAPQGTTYLSASGFLPGYPVTVMIDGQKAGPKLTASPLGDVTEMIDPQKLALAPGQHTVTLQSLLIDETGEFTSQ